MGNFDAMTPDQKMLQVAAAEYTLHRAALKDCVEALEYWRECSPRIPYWNARTGGGTKILKQAKKVLKPRYPAPDGGLEVNRY